MDSGIPGRTAVRNDKVTTHARQPFRTSRTYQRPIRGGAAATSHSPEKARTSSAPMGADRRFSAHLFGGQQPSIADVGREGRGRESNDGTGRPRVGVDVVPPVHAEQANNLHELDGGRAPGGPGHVDRGGLVGAFAPAVSHADRGVGHPELLLVHRPGRRIGPLEPNGENLGRRANVHRWRRIVDPGAPRDDLWGRARCSAGTRTEALKVVEAIGLAVVRAGLQRQRPPRRDNAARSRPRLPHAAAKERLRRRCQLGHLAEKVGVVGILRQLSREPRLGNAKHLGREFDPSAGEELGDGPDRRPDHGSDLQISGVGAGGAIGELEEEPAVHHRRVPELSRPSDFCQFPSQRCYQFDFCRPALVLPSRRANSAPAWDAVRAKSMGRDTWLSSPAAFSHPRTSEIRHAAAPRARATPGLRDAELHRWPRSIGGSSLQEREGRRRQAPPTWQIGKATTCTPGPAGSA